MGMPTDAGQRLGMDVERLSPVSRFQMDFPYRENSAPWFGYRKVCKGGCWATSAPIARAGYRHSFWPEMNAVYVGFRVAIDGAPNAIGKL